MASFDSDAQINEGKAGYSINMVNPTDSEVTTFGVMSKAGDISTAANYVTRIFAKTGWDRTVTADSYTSKWSHGMKLESDHTEDITSEWMEAKGVTITYTVTSAGSLLQDEYGYADDYKAIIQAVSQYLGDDVSPGDVLKVTGKVKTEFSAKNTGDLAVVSDGVKVVKKTENTQYYVTDIDVKIEFTHGGETKSITATSNFKFMFERSADYDYHGVAYADLTASSPCTIKYGPNKYSLETGDITYKVNDKSHSAEYRLPYIPDQETTANLLTDDFINSVLTDLKNEAAAIPAGTANVTVGREYSDAESAYNEVAVDVAEDGLVKLLMIIGGIILGIIVLIVVVIVVVVVMRNKKKRQAV
jgi:hypothetical protein